MRDQPGFAGAYLTDDAPPADEPPPVPEEAPPEAPDAEPKKSLGSRILGAFAAPDAAERLV